MLSVVTLEAIVVLAKVYQGADVACSMATPEWARVRDLECGMPDGLSLGYFMRLQDCSAKEFECYHDECGAHVYARAGDILFQQRRKYKMEIGGNQPVLGDPSPTIFYMRAESGRTVTGRPLAALIVHDKCLIYTAKHIQRGEAIPPPCGSTRAEGANKFFYSFFLKKNLVYQTFQSTSSSRKMI